MPKSASARTAALVTCALTLLTAAAGCGGPKVARVKGVATVDGKPANAAVVMFSAGENLMTSATVRNDGTYEVDDVPVGPVRVNIMPGMSPTGMANVAEATKTTGPLARIPGRYTNPNTSQLALTVQPGENQFDIAMTSK